MGVAFDGFEGPRRAQKEALFMARASIRKRSMP
jgi:hypothetical protein